MRALVVGGDGLVGRALCHALGAAGHSWVATTRRRSAAGQGAQFFDLATIEGLWELPDDVDAVFICAALSKKVDDLDSVAARQVNVDTPWLVAQRLGQRGAHVVLLSSTAVFDGERAGRAEDEAPCPATLYGRQKAEAEALVLREGGAALRLSKILDPAWPLLRGWVADLVAGRPVRAVDNLRIAPVALASVCAGLMAIGERGGAGIFHLSAESDVSYADVAAYLAVRLAPGRAREKVFPVSRDALGITAPDWGRTALSCRRLTELAGIAPPSPLAEVERVYGDLLRLAREDAA